MKSIAIQNFKCFCEKESIDFSNITINVGMNSVGKSTVVQAMLLLRKTFEEISRYRGTKANEFFIPLNSTFDLQIGSYEQVTPKANEKIVFSIDGYDIEYMRGKDEFSLVYTKENALELLPKCSLFDNNFYYINAERSGPRNFQIIGESNSSFCGYHGEYTFEVLEKFYNHQIEDKRKRIGDDFTVNILSKQVEYWMDYIVPGVEFSTSRDLDTRTAKLKIRQALQDTDFNSPYNFGFGISYILPIIVTGLLATKNSVFIVENPEAHLHPSGQSKIGYFLAQIADAGIKVVIETHSEHVINGIRLYSLKNDISPDKVCINYFSIQEKSTQVQRIPMNDRMDLLSWPQGFFDQEEKDLSELRHIRSTK